MIFFRYFWSLFLVKKATLSSNSRSMQNKCKMRNPWRLCQLSVTMVENSRMYHLNNYMTNMESLIIFQYQGRNPQQNDVVERNNWYLVEIARRRLSDSNLPKYVWTDAVSTTCYVSNWVIIRPILKNTPYELLKGRKPNIYHLHVFRCKWFVFNNDKYNSVSSMRNAMKVLLLDTLSKVRLI